jgi:hypothetical protein
MVWPLAKPEQIKLGSCCQSAGSIVTSVHCVNLKGMTGVEQGAEQLQRFQAPKHLHKPNFLFLLLIICWRP